MKTRNKVFIAGVVAGLFILFSPSFALAKTNVITQEEQIVQLTRQLNRLIKLMEELKAQIKAEEVEAPVEKVLQQTPKKEESPVVPQRPNPYPHNVSA